MFCHEEWNEELEIVNWQDVEESEIGSLNEEQLKTLEENNGKYRIKDVKKFQWFLPCRFEKTEHGAKDMLAYYILYNMTLSPSNMYTSPDKSLKVDSQLLALKNNLDNSFLEVKA